MSTAEDASVKNTLTWAESVSATAADRVIEHLNRLFDDAPNPRAVVRTKALPYLDDAFAKLSLKYYETTREALKRAGTYNRAAFEASMKRAGDSVAERVTVVCHQHGLDMRVKHMTARVIGGGGSIGSTHKKRMWAKKVLFRRGRMMSLFCVLKS